MPRLVLEVADTKIELPIRCEDTQGTEDACAQSPSLCLGKNDDNDLVAQSAQTSRQHAVIEVRHNDFYLVDRSTNGTYVQTEDEQVTLVHRNSIRLWGAGWISLGQPLAVGSPIHFRQIDRR